MALRRQALRIPSPGTQATPDSGDHGRVVFPSTPQHTQAPRSLQLDVGAGLGAAEPAGRPRIPRAKSSGDVHASRFSQRSAAAVAAAAGATVPPGAMLMAPMASVMSSHAVVQHVEAVQIASQQGAFAFREGFTESPLGAGRMHVTPTDVLICIGAASAKSAGAAAAANEGYAPTVPPAAGPTQYQSPTVRSPTVPAQSLPTYLDAARQAAGGGKDKEAERSSDRFIHIARLAIASVTFYAAGSASAFSGSDTGSLRRDRSLAQLQASSHNRSSLEIRTRDFCLVTVCFSSSVRATDAVINELLRPPAVNLFRSSPLRPQPHHLYGVSSLALRLQFPMKLVAAGLHRASIASGGAAVGLDLGPTVSQTVQEQAGDADPLQVCTPGTQHQPAAFPATQDAPPSGSWFVYDPAAEMERQQYPRGRPVGAARDVAADATWPVRLCHVNADYSVCPSYPPVLVEPRDATDEMVADEATKRTRNRVQTCAFVYEPTRNCLFRSSQPRNGASLLGWMVTEHESPLMGCIRRSCATQELKVVDLRPYANAIGNSLFRGGGHEATRRKGTEVLFANIENVDHVNAAYNEVAQLCFAHHTAPNCVRSAGTPPSAFLSAVAKTAWLDLLHAVLGASVRVARFIAGVDGPGGDVNAASARAPRASLGGSAPVPPLVGTSGGSGCNVLIHCSDGWDRTAQVSALAQLLLDPWFRTVRGFCVLVEKEFLHCGHQFASRAHFPRATTLGAHDFPTDPAFHTGLRPDPSTTASSLAGESTMPTPQKIGLPRGAAAVDGWDALEHHDTAAGDDDHDDGHDDWDHSDCHDERDCGSPNLRRTPPAAPFAAGGRQSVGSQGRHGHVRSGGGGHEACPIFVQFIDAVHQLVEMYPADFELTPQALIWLLDAYHSGFYSTFACDNHSQLMASGLVGRHTANALGELSGLGGTFAHPQAGSEASSVHKGMPPAASSATGRQLPNTSSSYVDVGSLTDAAMGGGAMSPAESTPAEGTTPPQPPGLAANTSLTGPLVNPTYSWEAASASGALLGLIGPQRLRLWEEYFCRYSDGAQPVAVAGRSCVPDAARQPRRLSKLAAAGGSFESFDALSASMAEWQSVGGSRVSSPNNYGTAYPPGQRIPQGPQAAVAAGGGGGTPAGSGRGDDSPAPPPSPGKPARIAASQMCMPAFQTKKFQENWN